MGREPNAPPRGTRPAIFVVGVARSGTTLLRLMLDAHPELAIPPETHFISKVIRACEEGADPHADALAEITGHRRWLDFGLDAEALRERFATHRRLAPGDAMREFYGLYASQHGKTRWGDKSTNYIRKMKPISRVLPEARFIHLIRDGRDVALSLVAVHFGPQTVDAAAEKWRSEIVKARRQGPKLPGYLEIRYEDLIADPEAVLRAVCEATDLPWDDAMLDYQDRAGGRIAEIVRDFDRAEGQAISADARAAHHANVSKPLQSDRAARWRTEMPVADLTAFEGIAGGLLDELGYERASAS
ncbi:MAG: sulfotransferase family protein [Solirubrobacterales bacterium]